MQNDQQLQEALEKIGDWFILILGLLSGFSKEASDKIYMQLLKETLNFHGKCDAMFRTDRARELANEIIKKMKGKEEVPEEKAEDLPVTIFGACKCQKCQLIYWGQYLDGKVYICTTCSQIEDEVSIPLELLKDPEEYVRQINPLV